MWPRKSFVLRTIALFLSTFLLFFIWISSPLKDADNYLTKKFLGKQDFNLEEARRHSVNAEKSKDTQLFKQNPVQERGQLSGMVFRPNISAATPPYFPPFKYDDSDDDVMNMTSEEMELVAERNAIINISKEELKLALTVNIVNPHDFNVLINNEHICSGRKPIFLIIYIHSAPDHFQRRIAIRETWGNPSMFRSPRQIRTVFMIGRTTSESVQNSIILENNIYHDIVQEDYLDSYKNLTYKGVQGLRWVANHCSHAAYVLKTDDDIFVNIFSLLTHLESLRMHGVAISNTILCNVWTTMIVMRDKKSKWYVSKEEFKDDMYPTYCSGSAYLFTTDLIPRMYLASKTTKFFWVDDFYITGLLAQKVNASFHNFNSLYVLNANAVVKEFTGGDNWTWVFGHLHGLDKMYYVWKRIAQKFAKAIASQQ